MTGICITRTKMPELLGIFQVKVVNFGKLGLPQKKLVLMVDTMGTLELTTHGMTQQKENFGKWGKVFLALQVKLLQKLVML